MPRKKHRPFTLAQCSKGGQWSPRRERDLHELVQAFREDRKGYVVAEGVSNGVAWQLRHSTAHALQFDVLYDDKVIARGNPRSLPTKFLRARARRAARENTSYRAIGQATPSA